MLCDASASFVSSTRMPWSLRVRSMLHLELYSFANIIVRAILQLACISSAVLY